MTAVATTTRNNNTTLTRESLRSESFFSNTTGSYTNRVPLAPLVADCNTSRTHVLDRRRLIRPYNYPVRSPLGPFAAQRPIPPPIRITMADEEVKKEDEQEHETKTSEDITVDVPAATSDTDVTSKEHTSEDIIDTPKAKVEELEPIPADSASADDTSTAKDLGKSAPTQPDAESAAKRSSLTPSVGSDTPLPSRPRPLSQRLMSGPNGRDRSASPGRFPVKVDGSNTPRSSSPAHTARQGSPSKRVSTDLTSTEASSSAIDDSQPPPVPPKQSSTPAPGILRKASSGFGGFLGRMGSMGKNAQSPSRGSGVDRRNSAHSASGYDRTSVANLAAIADGAEDTESTRPSLQDRFRTLREQEEQHEDDGDHDFEHEDPMDGKTKVDASKTATRTKRTSSTVSQLKSPTLDTNLPPGTASGMSAGPSKEPAPVNWDLWQSVVYEGPAAVARTSGDELSQAIASGIPAAIRGVVWQVLAESKSEELEALYKTLKTRGTESDLKPPALPRTDSEISQPEKESSTSSRSSISETPDAAADSSLTTTSPSIESSTAEVQHKLLAEKHKRESAAIQKLEKTIRRDLGARTSFSKYTQSAGLQDGLFGVCKAYALFDTPVGYAQGINFIAMPLLFNMSEEEAFTLLIRLMHHYQVRTLFEPDMPGLHLRLYQFERLLEDHEPALFCHLKRRHVSPNLYATQWFLTLFAYRFPLQLVLRVYDMIFSEGLTAILRFGLVLMQKNREALLEMKDMSQLSTFLKEKLFDAYIDKSPSASSILDSGFFGSVSGGADKELYRADELVQDVTRIKISPELLQAYEVEWEEQRRTEHEREAELDDLRTTNSTLLNKVKTLEDRVLQHDSEHVGIASDLVKYKIENDTLHDAKEALEMQVQELQKMVDSQPAEVEKRLKEEMDRIMQRNLEVQNENRHLQDELENAEQQLVKISLTHAETQTELDTIKQKWSGLQAMMNGK
ncbi:hypothetical protein AMS68_002791 [Peltaster fructicola]|uniref:GTPase-activating protein GYP5 n=1 Tax=Peltaster fructicola TaxID=286661 RepID=A0A6H0XRB5_9PEZI|nr:hypothetical protein AMS68_002791 [Peltaster fructicola]